LKKKKYKKKSVESVEIEKQRNEGYGEEEATKRENEIGEIESAEASKTL